MAQTQSGRIERVERTLRRLGHKLEKRGRGYQLGTTPTPSSAARTPSRLMRSKAG
jgi:hypothetical protein